MINNKDKQIAIENAIKQIDQDESKAKQFFKYAYNYDNFKKDYPEWRKFWFSLKQDEKEKILSKGMKGGDFEKVMNALILSKGNPFKAYKALKILKKKEEKKDESKTDRKKD